jgi:FlaA1/EpsC-like NDP-sugar epimerase
MGFDGADSKNTKNNNDCENENSNTIKVFFTVLAIAISLILLFNGKFVFFTIFVIGCLVLAASKTKDPQEKSIIKTDYALIERQITELFEQNRDLISSLVFVSRADGQMRDTERDIIIFLLLKLSKHKDLPTYDIEQKLIAIPKITNEQFENIVKRMSQEKTMIDIFKKAVSDIIGTQKKVSPGELYCKMIIEKYQ